MELNNNIVEGKQYYYILFLDKVYLFFFIIFLFNYIFSFKEDRFLLENKKKLQKYEGI